RGRVRQAKVVAQERRQLLRILRPARLLQPDNRAAAKLLGDGPRAAAQFSGIESVVCILVAALAQPLEIVGAERKLAVTRRRRYGQPALGSAVAGRDCCLTG